MRPILFRGRDEYGQWHYGHFLGVSAEASPRSDSPTVIEFAEILDEDRITHRVLPETVGEFTGVRAPDGTKLFEGDLISTYDITNGEIRFAPEWAAFVVKTEEHQYLLDEIIHSPISGKTVKLNGTIWD